MAENLKAISKFLSLILRHQPETIELSLDAQGWASVDELIVKANQHGTRLNHDSLIDVVTNNDKQRFSLSDDGLKIRANQGHSLAVDLALIAQQPPEVLYHGTTTRFLDSILAVGLKPQQRQYVHLSDDKSTASKVGQRHGKSVILEIAATTMWQEGYTFYLSDNQVWLTANVPTDYLKILPD